MGFMGIIDIEGPRNGARAFESETLWDSKNLVGVALLTGFGFVLLRRIMAMRSGQSGAEVIEGFGSDYERYH